MMKEGSGNFLNDEELDGVVGGVRIHKDGGIEMSSPDYTVSPISAPAGSVTIPDPSTSRLNFYVVAPGEIKVQK